ncbi:MAG: HlyC/CorC family transporter [Acidimicrobiia bacterium]|nr:HlyC/CorC family transporter [Acidimicrobiia bacterium]
MTTALGLAAVAVLIALNGYFVAAEFAYVSVRRSELEAERARRPRQVERALGIVKRLSFMLSGAQLGITVMSVVIGFIAEPSIGEAIEPLLRGVGIGESAVEPIALVVAFVLATSAQMLFGELFPKNLSIAKAQQVSLSIATITWLYTKIAAPVIRLFDSSANALLSLFGIEPIEELHGGVTADELDFIVEESVRDGHLTQQQAELVSRSIEFPVLDAVDAMRHRRDVMTVAADATGRMLRTVAAQAHSRLPVVTPADGGDREQVVGVIEIKDLLTIPIERRDEALVSTIMREPLIVPEHLPLPDVLAAMREHITELAVVVDEYGEYSGIITDEDLAEELVGPIDDEHDEQPEPVIAERGERQWTVPGEMRLHEVERETGIELPDGEYDTIAGLLLDRLGHFPEPGEQAEIEGHELTVLAMDGLRIVELRLAGAPEVPNDDDEREDRS